MNEDDMEKADFDEIEFSVAPALLICFAVALLIGLVVTH